MAGNQPSFDLVIFDHDGVLVDSEIIAMALLAELAAEHGCPMSVDEAIDVFLGTSLDFVAQTIRERGGLVELADLDAVFHQRLFRGFREQLVALPGMHELLVALSAMGMPICIASSGSAERVRLGLSSTGLDGFFDAKAITTREQVTRGKPHPDLFLRAAGLAKTPAQRCLVIEDSAHGVAAARAAGMSVIGLAYRTPASALAEADWVVADPGDILAIVTGDLASANTSTDSSA